MPVVIRGVAVGWGRTPTAALRHMRDRHDSAVLRAMERPDVKVGKPMAAPVERRLRVDVIFQNVVRLCLLETHRNGKYFQERTRERWRRGVVMGSVPGLTPKPLRDAWMASLILHEASRMREAIGGVWMPGSKRRPIAWVQPVSGEWPTWRKWPTTPLGAEGCWFEVEL
jgi:hypothetical protein